MQISLKYYPSYYCLCASPALVLRHLASRTNIQQTCMMGSNSKVLLDLEAANSSTSSLESKLQFYGKDDVFLQPGTVKLNPPEQKPTISPVPKSHVLGKVKDFLGVISESNRNLIQEAKDNPENYDIEVMSGRESEYIEMDLMLGVADLHTPEAVAAAESAIAGYQPIIPLAADRSRGSESEDSSDDDDVEDVEEEEAGKHSAKFSSKVAEKDSSKASRNQKSRKRLKIVELS